MNRSARTLLQVAAVLFCASPALAAAPSATTTAASGITATSANLNGSINPNGESTTGWFRLSNSPQTTCDDNFGTRVPGSLGTSIGAGMVSQSYSITATGLLPGNTYYFCAIAQNASGTVFGNVLTFSTPAQAPTVTTVAATDVTSSSAVLNGSANPNGAATTAYFRYSTSSSTACSSKTRFPASGGTDLAAGNTTSSYVHTLTGLSAGVTYYFCAAATNGGGTTYGNILSFTTLVAAPTVTSSAATSVGGSSARLNGSANPNGAATLGWFRYSETDPVGCNDAFGTRIPAVSGGTALGSTSTPTAYYQSISGLQNGTTYYYCAIAENSVGTSFGQVLTFTTAAAPTVTTKPPTSLTETSATLQAEAIPNRASATGWLRYGTTNPGVCTDNFGTRVPYSAFYDAALGGGTAAVPYSQSVSGLLPGTTYYVCAFASNSVGVGVGNVLVFTTPPAAPEVMTYVPTAVTRASARLNGSADPRGAATTAYLRYGTAAVTTCSEAYGTRLPTSGGTSINAGNGYVDFFQDLAGLTPKTRYYYCAAAVNSVGTTFGQVYSFDTPDVPEVVTNPATAVGGTSAVLHGTGDPNYASAEGYFRYDTVQPSSCNDTFGTRAPLSSGSYLGSGTAPMAFSSSIAGLTPGTTYYYCALASNSEGVGMGAVLSFTTPSAPTVNTVAQTNLVATSVTLNGTAAPNGASTTGFFRLGTTATTTCTGSYGTRLPPTSGGTALGSGYAAEPFTYAISVTPGTTYYYCAAATNSVGTVYGPVLTFTSPPTAPIVINDGVTDLTGTTATFNGEANPRGAATTGWFRYGTVNPATCNDNFGTRFPASGGTALVANNTYQFFDEAVTGLTPGTTYYMCALASNSEGTSFGDVVSFTTPDVPTMTTNAATSVAGTSAMITGAGIPNRATTYGYFRYGTTAITTCDETYGTRIPSSGGTYLGSGTTSSNYNQSLTGLTPGTTYYYCAAGDNVVGTGFGQVRTFKTPDRPTVTTEVQTNLTATSVTLEGSAIPEGALATGYFRYHTIDPVNCNNSFGTRAPAGTGGTSLGSGYTSTPYSVTPTGLLPGTTYYYCALASNSVGLGMGSVRSFTTPPTAPLVVTSTPTTVTASSATLAGSTNARGASTTAWFRYSNVDPVTCNDSFGLRAPAGTGGDAIGSGTSYVAHSEPITGLSLATTYYYCAIAENSEGKSFGDVIAFTTEPLPPTVTTVAASNVTTTQASFNATAIPNGAASTGWFRYSTTNPGACDDFFGTRAPASGGTTLGSGTASETYSVTHTTLAPGVTYYYCAIASNSAGKSYGEILSVKTVSTPPTATTLAATNLTSTTAQLNGSSNANGDPTTGWFRLGTAPGTCSDTFGTRQPATGTVTIGSGTSAQPYSHALTNLTANTAYYFCAVAQNSLGTTYGSVLTFTTPAVPSMTTSPASPVTATTATLTGSGIANGTAAQGWFRYDTVAPSGCNDSFGLRTPLTGGTSLGSGTTSVAFSRPLSGLTPGTTYYYCAIGSNAEGTGFGELLSFTTPPTAPMVATLDASAVTATSATLNASANPNGAATTGWFRFGTSNPGTCSDSYGTRAPVGAGGTAIAAGNTAVSFSQTITGLAAGTTYYFCPMASNSVGTASGGVLSFTTLAAPTVTTNAASFVGTTTAQLNGSADPNLGQTQGWFRYHTSAPAACDDAFGSRAPTTGGKDVGSGSTPQAFFEGLTGLQPGTTYYYCAIAENPVGKVFGELLSFTTLTAPAVTTNAPSSIASTSAMLDAQVNPNGQSTSGYFRYSTTSGTCSDGFGLRSPTTGATTLGSGTSAVPLTRSLTGLSPSTTYYYCAVAYNASGTTYGNVVSFTTYALPTVTTTAATAVGSSGATLNGTANPNGSQTTGYFRYGTGYVTTCSSAYGARVPTTGGTDVGNGRAAEPFEQVLTGLTPATTYYYCAVANNSIGTTYGPVLTFTTLATPAVTTLAATNATGTGATLNGSADPNNASTTGYFRWSTSTGTCSDSFGTRLPTVDGTSLGSGSTAQPFSENLTGLTPGSTYYYCAVATNAVGTSYGAVLSFTMPTAPVVTTSAATLITGSTVTLNGSADPNDADATGFFRYGTTNPVTCSDGFGARAPLNGGTALGAGSASVAFSRALSGLIPSTTYYFCAAATNSEGTTFGQVESFTTLAGPLVTTTAATGQSSTAATLNASINPNGSSTTAYFRYGTVDPGACNATFGLRAPSTGTLTVGSGTTATPISQAISALTGGTTYYYCAIATSGVGTSYGQVLSFNTAGMPTMTTDAPTNIATTSVTLNGTANPNGSSTTGHFRYSTSNPGTCYSTFGYRAPPTSGGTTLTGDFTPDPYSYNLTGLQPGTTYYYCAYGTNAYGTRWGAVMSFTTQAGPTATTSAATSLTSTSATLNGAANPRGTSATGWFRYGTTNPGTCNDGYGTRLPASGGSTLGAGTASVAFEEPLTGLQPGTTYYFCAAATNAIGTAYGSVLSFTTTNVPSVTTTAATLVDSTSATLNGSADPNGASTTGYFRYGTTSPTTCDDSYGTRAPASGGDALGTGQSAVAFSEPLTGLTPGTLYYYCAAATNSVGTTFGTVLSFRTPELPTVTTVAATAVAGTSATLNGTANPNGGATTGWFRYSATSQASCNDTFGTRLPTTGGTSLGSGTTAANFSQPLTGLLPGTTYYYCALGSNVVGTAVGSVLTFTTPATAPTVTTSAATSIGGTSAVLNGAASAGGAAATGWFRFGTAHPGSCNDTFGTRAPTSGGASLGSGNGSVSFSQPVTLAPGLTYYFCAIASNSVGKSYGAVLSFSTPAAPTVTTSAATAITGTGATLNGSAIPNGAAATGHFRYATSNPGTCNDSFGTRSPLTGGTSLGAGAFSVPFTAAPTTLTAGATYYFCAIAVNSVGTSFGEVLSFTTPSAPTVVTSSASGIGNGGATLNGTANPNRAAATAWFRFSATNPGSCSDTFGVRAPATGGTSVGAGTTASGYSQAISDLLPGVTYYFCAVAENSVGKAYGQLLSFTAEAPPPLVTTAAATDLESRAATLHGQANPRGTTAIGWFRYSATKPATCDDTFGTRVPAADGIALGAGSIGAPYLLAITGLKPNVTYHYCAIASNQGGAATGELLSFKTGTEMPTVRTIGTTVAGDTANLTASANPNGSEALAWIHHDTKHPGACTAGFGKREPVEGIKLGAGHDEVPLTHMLSALQPGTYYYCAVVITEAGAAYSDVRSFEIGGGATGQGCGCGSGASGAATAFAVLAGLALLRRRRRS